MVFGLRLRLHKKAQDAKATLETESSPSASGTNEGGKRTNLTVNEFVARTKKCREQGLEPTKPELITYAKYLGIDPVNDGDLMWISDEALKAPLPSEWTEHHDSADRVFYYNVHNQQSSWTHPLEQLHRDTYKDIVKFRSGNLSREEQLAELELQRKKVESAEKEAHLELQAWTEHSDEQGQKFFYNKEQKRSVWTDPRPATCHILYLQMKALRVLGKFCGQSGTSPRGSEAKGIALLENAHSGMASGRDSELESSNCPREGRHRRRKHRKAKRRKEMDVSSPVGSSDDGEGELRRPDFLDVKKPSTANINELRSALGVGAVPRPHALFSGGNQLEDDLSYLGQRLGSGHSGHSDSPLGDGLSNRGRVKVRAGIRLQPLNGGA
mmetsp:Transcript_108906/g.216275  ORF Transcript_108906/g.216275 Transcript_108906/m.216275 type:complete len:383 (-) Transcript_108906:218-1366(-)